MIAKHQRVKLNDRGVSYFYASGGSPARSHPDWSSRTGIVYRITTDRARAHIVWDGNKSPSDGVPVMFLVEA